MLERGDVTSILLWEKWRLTSGFPSLRVRCSRRTASHAVSSGLPWERIEIYSVNAFRCSFWSRWSSLRRPWPDPQAPQQNRGVVAIPPSRHRFAAKTVSARLGVWDAAVSAAEPGHVKDSRDGRGKADHGALARPAEGMSLRSSGRSTTGRSTNRQPDIATSAVEDSAIRTEWLRRSTNPWTFDPST
jgi:hypothetical protein